MTAAAPGVPQEKTVSSDSPAILSDSVIITLLLAQRHKKQNVINSFKF
jgi:hypothetical protein